MAGIAARYGAVSKVSKVVAGNYAGSMALWNLYENNAAAASALSAYVKDPEHLAIMAEVGLQPAAEREGPEVARWVFGDPSGKPMLEHREWIVGRTNVQQMLDLAAEVEDIIKSYGDSISALVPSFSSDNQVMYVN